MNKHRIVKRIMVFLMAVGIAAGNMGTALAAETGESVAIVNGDSPAGSTGPNDGQAAGERELTADSYEIYSTGTGKGEVDVLRKGRHAKVIVSVKNPDIKTKDISESEISVSKIKDSFRTSVTPKVKITSGKEDDLEYTVTFSKVTYLGKGNELKFQVKYKNSGRTPDIVAVEISECEEYESKGSSSSDDSNGQPVIKIKKISPQAPVGQGESFVLELELENTSSDTDIEDLVVNVNIAGGMFIKEDTNSRLVKRINTKKTAKISLNMQAGQELTGPYQVLDLELKYNYYSGNNIASGTSTQKVQIPVKGGSSGQPLIKVSRNEIGGAIQAGQAFDIVVRLENTSKEREIRNMTATFEPNDQISLLEQTDARLIGNLAAGQAIEIPIRLQAAAELSGSASQLLGMTLKFDYDSDKGTVQGTHAEKIVIPSVGSQKKSSSATPNIIIGNYTYGDRVSAGQVFDLNLELSNTSGQLPVENVVMSLDTGEGISINSSSNTIYIPKLNAGETKKESVKVQALFQSKLQSPKITISFKYEYMDQKERKQASSTEVIAIPVYQPDRFELKTPVYSENMKNGEEGTISIPYVNKGRGQVFNVEASLDCDVKTLEKNLVAGNFESGKSGTLDFVITPQRQGEFKGQVKVSYEDEAMELKTLVVPLSFTVQEAQDPNEALADGEDPQLTETGKGKKLMVILAALAVIALIVVVLVKRKKRANQPAIAEKWEDKVETEESWEAEAREDEAENDDPENDLGDDQEEGNPEDGQEEDREDGES